MPLLTYEYYEAAFTLPTTLTLYIDTVTYTVFLRNVGIDLQLQPQDSGSMSFRKVCTHRPFQNITFRVLLSVRTQV